MRWIAIALLAAGCAAAHDVHTRLPGHALDTGTVILHFTHSVDHAHVSINGTPVAQDVNTQHVVVDNVPAGDATVMLAADGVPEKAFVIQLRPGQHVTIPLAATDVSTGRTLFQALLTALIYATYLGVAAAL